MDDYAVYKRNSCLRNLGRYHFHEQYEILLSLSEGVQMFVADKSYPMQRGTLMLLPSTVLHRSASAEKIPYHRYVLRFSRQYAERLSTNTTDLLRCFRQGRFRYQLTTEQLRRLSALYDVCLQKRKGFGSDLRHDIAFTELMLAVDEITSVAADPGEENASSSVASDVLAYVQNHLTEDLSLDVLADRFFLSKSHLCRLCKDFSGFSLGEYIIKSRIMRAQALLRDGRSVRETGESAGFRSYAHFVRTFRQNVGIPPGQYRKQWKENA